MRVACSFGVVATLLASACAASSPNPAPAPARPQTGTSPAGAQPNAGPPASGAGQGQGPSVGTNIAARTGGMERRAGLIPLYLDDRQGRIFLEIPRDSMRVLAFFQRSTGLGSNPIGIDRAQNGPDQVTRFERNGDRVIVIFENWNYRGESQRDPGLATTIAESFPASTVAAFPLLAVEG